MKQEYKDKIKHEIESEGIVYTFTDLGDWKHIKDEKFHKLRKDFVKAFESFSDYLVSIGAYPVDEEVYEVEEDEKFEEENSGCWVNGVWTNSKED